jgi:hypothetical protein
MKKHIMLIREVVDGWEYRIVESTVRRLVSAEWKYMNHSENISLEDIAEHFNSSTIINVTNHFRE